MKEEFIKKLEEIKILTHPSNQYDRRDMIRTLDEIFNIVSVILNDYKLNN